MSSYDKKVGDGTVMSLFKQTKPNIICPEFWECKPFNGCTYDCAWCYLNGTYRFTKNKKGVQIGKSPTFKDPAKVEEHVRRALEKIDEPTMFNAGEVSDGLLFPWMLEQHVVPIFKEFKKKGHKLLILTKSADVSSLYNMKAQDCVVVAFSVNAHYVAATWEDKAPHPWERLKAAGKVSDWGYPVRLRIDPMVPVEDWETGYRELIEKIFKHVPKVEVITLGSLRMMATNLRTCESIGNDTSYVQYLGEKTSRDLRAPTETRVEMYLFAIKELRTRGYKGAISLCKETKEVWGLLLKETKAANEQLKKQLGHDPPVPIFLNPPGKNVCNCRLDSMEESKKEA